MAKIILIVATLCVLQLASARHAREAPTSSDPAVLPSLSDLTKQAEEALGAVHTKFLEFVGVRNNEELVNLVQERGKTYADQLQELVGQLGEQARTHAGKADEVFSGLTTQLGETIQELRSKNPEFTGNIERLEARFQESLRNVLHSTENLTERMKAEGESLRPEFENVVKQIVDNTRDAAKKIVEDLQKPNTATPQ